MNALVLTGCVYVGGPKGLSWWKKICLMLCIAPPADRGQRKVDGHNDKHSSRDEQRGTQSNFSSAYDTRMGSFFSQ